ncbi:MAG TPA: hypothetical protein VN025_08800 [Candidatus Dormibacteraeota bacterium]|jgi:hypothetical protein|nr:hypothetical protein [Candidatus Dormibacteraeota bacterium]
MQGQTQKGFSGKSSDKAKVGRLMFWLGSLVFLGESWLLIARLAEFWRGSGAASLGLVAALGVVAQKALSILVWNQGLLLAAAVKVLVLCCPLVILFAGFVIMKSVTHANEGAAIKGQATSEEGDDR